MHCRTCMSAYTVITPYIEIEWEDKNCNFLQLKECPLRPLIRITIMMVNYNNVNYTWLRGKESEQQISIYLPVAYRLYQIHDSLLCRYGHAIVVWNVRALLSDAYVSTGFWNDCTTSSIYLRSRIESFLAICKWKRGAICDTDERHDVLWSLSAKIPLSPIIQLQNIQCDTRSNAV